MTENRAIPEAAVDELLKAISLNVGNVSSREVARLALAAAAPFLIHPAWERGREYGGEEARRG